MTSRAFLLAVVTVLVAKVAHAEEPRPLAPGAWAAPPAPEPEPAAPLEPPLEQPAAPAPKSAPVPAPKSAQVPAPWRPALPPEREVLFDVNDPRAELQIRIPDRSGKLVWKRVCRGSCRTSLPTTLDYRVASESVHGSRVFVVPGGSGAYYVKAEAGSRNRWITGLVLTPIGGVVATFGAMGLGIMATCHTAGCEENREAKQVLAVSMLAGGLAIGATGLLLLSSARTKLVLDDDSDAVRTELALGSGVTLGPAGLSF